MDPLSYFSFQPLLHDWCKKGCGMCYPVCGVVHIKEPLELIKNSSPCGGSRFPLSLFVWYFTICLTLNASLNKTFPSFCKASPGRLVILLQVVQQIWNCLVSCPHRSHTSDPFIHLEEKSSTSMWAVSVYWQFSTFNFFFLTAVILLKQGKLYLEEEIWWIPSNTTPHLYYCF